MENPALVRVAELETGENINSWKCFGDLYDTRTPLPDYVPVTYVYAETPKRFFRSGMRNVGSICYYIAALQVLASSPILARECAAWKAVDHQELEKQSKDDRQALVALWRDSLAHDIKKVLYLRILILCQMKINSI